MNRTGERYLDEWNIVQMNELYENHDAESSKINVFN